ncbi:uncharacterized protein LOC144600747 [Rhinoraja longicauda]
MFRTHHSFRWHLILGILTLIHTHPALAGPSLRGQKATFDVPSRSGSLRSGMLLPTLTNLTACLDIYPTHSLSKWAAFSYQLPAAGSALELGLGGQGNSLRVWLSGTTTTLPVRLGLRAWHTVCFSWDSAARLLVLYLNQSWAAEARPPASGAQAGGSLALGRHQLWPANTTKPGHDLSWSFLGHLYLLRLWDRARTAAELAAPDCSPGNVLSWSAHYLSFSPGTLRPDPTLRCGLSTVPTASDGMSSTPPSSAGTTHSPTSSHRSTSPKWSSERTSSQTSAHRPTSLRSLSVRAPPTSSFDGTTSSPTLSGAVNNSSLRSVNYFRALMISIVSSWAGSPAAADVQAATNIWLSDIFRPKLVLLDVKLVKQRNAGSQRSSGNSPTLARTVLTTDRYRCDFRLEANSEAPASQIRREIGERLRSGDFVGAAMTLAADPATIDVRHFDWSKAAAGATVRGHRAGSWADSKSGSITTSCTGSRRI